MPGPTAKDPTLRGRRNKTTTRATLSKPAAETTEKPKLPSSIDWFPEVVAWWDDLWASEPRKEWIDVDTHLLAVAARLYQMMLDPDTKPLAAKALAGEYRQILVQFGLTPMARRTLQWEVLRVEGEKQNAARRASSGATSTTAAKATPRAAARVDPRKRRLAAVQ